MANRTRNRGVKKAPNTKSPNHKYGLIPVNNLTYGNPNAAQDLLVRNENQFDYIANHYMDKPYPNNDGEYSKNELQLIKNEMGKLEHEKVVSMSIRFDEDLKGMCMEIASKCGVENPEGFVSSIFEDIAPIIMKLKFFYNRIRPFQLANVYGFPLNPMPTTSSNSPSYPSGHTIQSKVLADVLTFRYPDKQDMLLKFADKVSKSRIILGVHFPSDEVFGLQISAGIVNDKSFIDKYFNVNRISDMNNKNNQSPSQQGNELFNNQQSIPQGHTQSHSMPEFMNGPMKRGGGHSITPPNTDVGGGDSSGVFGGLPAENNGMPAGR
jgi:hypothetical protein